MASLQDNPEREKLAPILQHPFTLAAVLYAIVYRLYGEEFHEWEPEALAMELQDDFGDTIPSVNLSKLNALVTAVSTNAFYQHWGAFMAITKTLNNSEDPLEMDDPLVAAEMAWAVMEVRLADDKPHEWGPDVASFVGAVLDQDGFVHPPKCLRFAKMPERYKGSDYPADTHKMETASTEHARAVQEYLHDQALLLLRQTAPLPWMTPESLQGLASELFGHIGQ